MPFQDVVQEIPLLVSLRSPIPVIDFTLNHSDSDNSKLINSDHIQDFSKYRLYQVQDIIKYKTLSSMRSSG
ncbi:MAG: hypothetical protein Q9208_002430 [Pyrenodesmia sp. 3 TL-2023]